MYADVARHTAREAAKATPPLGVVAVTLAGIDLQTWVYVAALVYTVLQGAYLVWKWVHEWRAAKVARPKPTVPPSA